MDEKLIPYSINEQGEVILSGRSLHEFLQIKTPLKIWISRMIEYGFEENQDYKIVMEKCKTAGGVQDLKDYILKADMAKEICMLQRTERGRQARMYFINLEKKFNSPEAILDRLKQLLGGNSFYIEDTTSEFEGSKTSYEESTISRLWQDNSAYTQNLMLSQDNPTYTQNSILSQDSPEYTQNPILPQNNQAYTQNPNNEIIYSSQVLSEIIPNTTSLIPSYTANYNSENFSDLNTNFRDTAKILGMKESMLIGWLVLRNFCYRDKYNSIRPYAEYMKYFSLRPFKSPSGHTGIQTLINSYGMDYFTNLLIDENLIEMNYMDIYDLNEQWCIQ